jgi:hypothetical protein
MRRQPRRNSAPSSRYPSGWWEREHSQDLPVHVGQPRAQHHRCAHDPDAPVHTPAGRGPSGRDARTGAGRHKIECYHSARRRLCDRQFPSGGYAEAESVPKRDSRSAPERPPDMWRPARTSPGSFASARSHQPGGLALRSGQSLTLTVLRRSILSREPICVLPHVTMDCPACGLWGGSVGRRRVERVRRGSVEAGFQLALPPCY